MRRHLQIPARRSLRNGPSRGFTLLETLVALAIVGAAVSVVGYGASGASIRAENARLAARVERELKIARSDAIRSGLRTIITIDPSARELQLNQRGAVRLPTDFAIDLLSAREAERVGKQAIVFRPDGTSSGGKLTLSRGVWRKTWTINWLTGDATS